MSREQIAVAIPSKGRPFGATFLMAKNLDVPVYVYVHEPEYNAYKDSLPSHFKIIKHNFSSISKIRRYIQMHQYDLGNTIIMVDDDVRAIWDYNCVYRAGLSSIINSASLHKSYDVLVPFIVAGCSPSDFKGNSLSECYVFSVLFVIRPSLLDKGVLFSEDDSISEDLDFTTQVFLRNASCGRLPYLLFHTFGDKFSNFSKLWYAKAYINLYKKYGDLYSIVLREDVFLKLPFSLIFNGHKVPETREKIEYSPLSNHVLKFLLTLQDCDPELKSTIDCVLFYIEDKPLTDKFLHNYYIAETFTKFPELRSRYYSTYSDYKLGRNIYEDNSHYLSIDVLFDM